MDIFLSYAGVDRERAKVLADALARASYSVWWDRTIPPGRVFDEVIQEAIAAARCVIVLWSADAVRSNWVKTEAAEGALRGLLVPALIEDVAPPIEFKRIQAANLTDWHGDDDDPQYRQLLDAVARLQQGSAPTPLRAHAVATTRSDGRLKTFGLGALSAVLMMGAAWWWLRPAPTGIADPTPQMRYAEEWAGAGDTPLPAAKPAPPAAVPGRVNLLAAANGGALLIASSDSWRKIVDGNEDSYGWTDKGFGVFGFADGRAARFDTFTVFISAQDNANLRDFELFAGNDGPDGPFQSLGRFRTQNQRNMQHPYQAFSFPPVAAKYFKFESLKSHGEAEAAYVYEVQLLGELR